MSETPKEKQLSDQSLSYHVIARAIEGKQIFQREEDRARFIFQMYAANTGSPRLNLYRKDVVKAAAAILSGNTIPRNMVTEEESYPLVHILGFCLVGNHYHFHLAPTQPKSISLYMQKLNIGFAKYFNLTYQRRGTLFEARYKGVAITTDFQLDAIIRYVNIKNALDIYQPGWREQGLQSRNNARKFLHRYPYSAFPDLFGKRSSHLLANPEVRKQFLGSDFSSSQTKTNFEHAFLETIKEQGNMRGDTKIFLE